MKSVQAAIDASSTGDVIILDPGMYNENINIGGKDVTLRSISPRSLDSITTTILNGNALDSVITFAGTESPLCIIEGVTVTGGRALYGGGIYGNKSMATVRNCIIRDNTALAMGGAGYEFGGAILNCLVYNNIAEGYVDDTVEPIHIWGTGGAFVEFYGSIINCTIWGNQAERSGGIFSCRNTILNNIIWNNFPNNYSSSGAPNYCCIEDWTGGGTGNITGNPALSDPDNGDFTLTEFSPGIDAGGATALVTEDIVGFPRPFDSWPRPRGDGSDLDMGAFEFTETITPPPTPTPTATPTPTPPPNIPPSLLISTPANKDEVASGTYIINWVAYDPNDDAAINLYYADYATGGGETLVADGLPEQDGPGVHMWNLRNVPEGIYQVYGWISDNYHAPVKSTAPGYLIVIHLKPQEILDHLLGRRPLAALRLELADLNQDGRLDMADFIKTLLPPPPEPLDIGNQ